MDENIIFVENEIVELKRSVSQLDKALKSVCAFANTNGGSVYFGIEDNGKIIGHDTNSTIISKIRDKINSNIEPKVNFSIKVKKFQEKNVILVDVKKGEQKLYLLNHIYYKREGDRDISIKGNELRNILIDDASREWELQVCEDFSIDDIDMNKFNVFVSLVRKSGRFPIENEDINVVLKKLNLVISGKFRNAAVLLFGKSNFDLILKYPLRCARFAGDLPIDFLDMRDFNGNLFELLDKGMFFLRDHLKNKAVIENLLRKETMEIPSEVLRESLVNALVHRNYLVENEDLKVAVFDNRVSIANPGGLPVDFSVEDLFYEHMSVPRNKLIAKVFYYAGLIEQWGSGTLRIINGVKNAGLKKPLFESNSNFKVTFMRHLSSGKKDKVGEKVTKKVTKKVTENQRRILDFMRENKYITSMELSSLINISDRKVKENIAKLKEKGLLERVGPAKGGFWRVLRE